MFYFFSLTFHYRKKSYEETQDILTEKIKSLKEELRLQQAEKDETGKFMQSNSLSA